MEFTEKVGQFPIDGYLRVGDPRRSSWTNGQEKALAFFWRPAGTQQSKLVRTQAPYIVRVIQRFFGAPVDGIFGEVTRSAVENHARRSGLNVPTNWTAGPQLLGYALQNALLGGGEVLFPARNEFPDTNRPARAPSPNGRESTYVGVLDMDTGREEPLNVPMPTPTQPSTMVPTPTQPSTMVPTPTPPSTMVPTPTPPSTMVPTPTQPFIGPDGNAYVVVQGVLYYVSPELLAQLNAGVQVQLPNVLGFVSGVPGQPCPKGYETDNGVCKLAGYGSVSGARMAVPNRHGIVVDFANPATYRNANLTPSVVTAGLLGTAATLFGAVLR